MIPPDPIHRRPRAQRNYPYKSGEIAGGGSMLNTKNTTNGHPSANIIEGSPQGGVNILDGEFNAVAGSHFTVKNLTINNSSEPSVRLNKPRKPRKPRKQNQGRENDNRQSTIRQETPPSDMAQLPPPMPNQGLATFVRSESEFFVPRSCDIYSRHLAPIGRGFPLWIPAPDRNLSVEHQRVGMQIGDVGIITSSGGFDFQFNVCFPRGHHFNPEEMPEGFEPLILNGNDIRAYSSHGRGSSLASVSVKKSFRQGESIFESSAQEGAILTMPAGSNTAELGNVKKLREYAAQHAQNWYRYVNVVRGRQARNGDVRMIIGFDKTTAWGMATFSNPPGQQEPSVFQFWSVEGDRKGREYGWDYSGAHMAEARSGPDATETEKLHTGITTPDGGSYENQCLFIRTLNVRLQDNIWDDLKDEFGATVDDDDYGDPFFYGPSFSRPGSSGSDSSAAFSSGHSTTGSGYGVSSARNFTTVSTNEMPQDNPLQQHPSTILNKMLLMENRHAKMAITNDHDWMSIITKDDVTLPSDMELYTRIKRDFLLCQEGDVAYLTKRESSIQEASTTSSEGMLQYDQYGDAEDFPTDDDNIFGFSPPEMSESAGFSTAPPQETVNNKPDAVVAYLRAQLSCKDASSSNLGKWAFSQYVHV